MQFNPTPEEIAKVILKKPDLRYVVCSDANSLIKKRKRLKGNSLKVYSKSTRLCQVNLVMPEVLKDISRIPASTSPTRSLTG